MLTAPYFVAVNNDSEAPGRSSVHSKTLKRCPFKSRRNVESDVDSRTATGRLFHIFGDARLKARAAVCVLDLLSGGNFISAEDDDRKHRTGL